MFRIFRLRPKKFLGIDIGTSSIKIVEIGKRGHTLILENYGEVKTSLTIRKPLQTFGKNDLLLSDQNTAKAIQSVCKEAGIQTKEVNFSIPDFCTFFTTFEIPAMSEEEIPEAIRYEVRPYVPLPLSEITLDWTVVKGQPSKTPLKVLVAAIPNEVISQYQRIAHLSKLKLKILEPEAFALARATVKNKNEKKVIGLIDIGARSTTCSVLEQGILKTSHSFNIASNHLTERLARSLAIDYNKAEELKIRYGLTFDEQVEGSRQSIRKILVPIVDLILEEIKKIFRSFYQEEGKEIDKIILGGGLAFLPGLKEYFFAELKKETVISNPFLDISYPPVLQKTLEKEGPAYAVAVGLALKGLE